MDANLFISVVIPTLGRTNVLERCLDSLVCQDFMNFEIIVISDTIEELQSVLRKYSQLKISVFEQEGKGLTSARNTGLRYAKGDIVSFIDDDVIASPGWTREIHNTFFKSLTIGGVSGPTIIPEELLGNRDILAFQNKIKSNVLWKLIGKFYTHFVLEDSPYSVGKIFKSGAFSLGSNYNESAKISSQIEVDYLEACNMSFRKDILDETGGFLPEYKGIGDWSEPDLAFRVARRGYRLVFNPKAQVNHLISQQGVYGKRGNDSFQRMKNFVHFYYKWLKDNTISGAFRFGVNLFFINGYWGYKFLTSGNYYWLTGIQGTLSGLMSQQCRR